MPPTGSAVGQAFQTPTSEIHVEEKAGASRVSPPSAQAPGSSGGSASGPAAPNNAGQVAGPSAQASGGPGGTVTAGAPSPGGASASSSAAVEQAFQAPTSEVHVDDNTSRVSSAGYTASGSPTTGGSSSSSSASVPPPAPSSPSPSGRTSRAPSEQGKSDAPKSSGASVSTLKTDGEGDAAQSARVPPPSQEELRRKIDRDRR